MIPFSLIFLEYKTTFWILILSVIIPRFPTGVNTARYLEIFSASGSGRLCRDRDMMPGRRTAACAVAVLHWLACSGWSALDGSQRPALAPAPLSRRPADNRAAFFYSRRQGQFPASPGLSLKSREHDCHWAGFISTLSRPRLLCPGMPHSIGRSFEFPGRPFQTNSASVAFSASGIPASGKGKKRKIR